jgi:hypothetical protein
MSALTLSKPESLSRRVAAVAEGNYVERLAGLQREIEQGVAAIAGWFRFSAERLVQSGEILCEVQEKMRGDFQDWFESNTEEIGYSFRTACAHMRIYRNWILRGRDLEKDLLEFKSQQEFLLALGISERPENENAGSGTKPLFRLAMAINGPPPEEWSTLDRREFLEKAKTVVDLYERVRALEEAA